MLSLSRPRTRALYRILDGARFDPEHPDQPLVQLEVNLIAWAEQCKLPSVIPGNIRRALASPHEELVKRGYLRAVNITGRGKAQMIRYEFVREFTPMDSALARRFRNYGVADGVARKLLREHGRAFLIECMDRFDLLVQRGVLVIRKSKAAALIHLIGHPDEYPYPNGATTSRSRVAGLDAAPPAAAKATRMEPLLDGPSVADEFVALSVEQQAEKLVARLTLLYRKQFSVTQLDALRQGVLDRKVVASKVLEEAVAALARNERDAFVRKLQEQLGGS